MPFQADSYEMGLTSEQLAYDLRQRYAKIVGDILEYELLPAIITKDYTKWFETLETIYSWVRHKINTKDKKAPKKYSDFREEVIKVSHECESTWTKNGNDMEEAAKINNALRRMQQYLLFRMDGANMFGSKRSMEGLL